MVKKLLKPKSLLIIILLFACFTRLYRLSYPNAYVFDEVYHGFTAKEYLKGNPAAWEWWSVPPPGVAFEWTHPPLAKEIMAASMGILHDTDNWVFRLPGALLGILSVYLIYLISKQLFSSETVSLLASFLFSIDGLNFVQSRTGMNDIYLVTFSLISLLFFLKKRWLLSSIFLGLALASKWTAIYLAMMFFILFLKDILKDRSLKNLKLVIAKRENHSLKAMDKTESSRVARDNTDFSPWRLIPFIFIPPVIYLISYIPFFRLGHTPNQFIELQKQIWWYHTHLKAHHDYSSPWWSWPLDLYPVWYYVQYFPKATANIFTVGNVAVFWLGSAATLLAIYHLFQKRLKELFIPILGFLIFWLPWAISPRIMFLYHFSPSVPFLSILLAYETHQISLKRGVWVITLVIAVTLLSFVVLYPWMSGVAIPKNLVQSFFLFNLAKDPFR